jgi:hypothetical protein
MNQMNQQIEEKNEKSTDVERFKSATERLKKIKSVLRNVTKKPQSREVQSLGVWEAEPICPCLSPEESQD